MMKDKEQFAVLRYKRSLDDFKDLLELRKAKRAEAKKRSIPLAEAKRRLGLS